MIRRCKKINLPFRLYRISYSALPIPCRIAGQGLLCYESSKNEESHMTHPALSKKIFFAGPLALIAFVFCVTWIFSYFLEPLYLCIPLLLAYYSFIWGFVAYYRQRIAKNDPVLKAQEFKPGFSGLTRWMLGWTIAYPLIVGGISFLWIAPRLPWIFILLGGVFSLVNGPSEEVFWRLLMERAGKDGGVGQKTRLWYGSAIFGAWHFVFVVFLMPARTIGPALGLTLSSTFVAGLLWMIVYQKTRNMFPLVFSHVLLNFLLIWPSTALVVLGLAPF